MRILVTPGRGFSHVAQWIALTIAHVLHYMLIALGLAILALTLIGFLTYDADHRQIRVRIDEIIAIWTAPRGVAAGCVSPGDRVPLDHPQIRMEDAR